MKSIFKNSTLLILSIFMTMTVLYAIPPGTTAQAADASILSQLPESTPGNFTVTWYSAKRYIPGREPGAGNPGGSYYHTHIGASNSGPVDKDKSDAALQNWDTSVVLKQEVIPDLTLDMTRWQPDSQYWTTRQNLMQDSLYNWNWCEVDGFIRLPYNKKHLYLGVLRVSTDSLLRSDVTCDLVIPDNGSLSSGDLVPFRLRIKCYEPDQSKLNTRFSIVFAADCWQHTDYLGNRTYDRISNILAGNVYGTLALKDMQPFFKLDAQNYTLTLDSKYSIFPVGDYEYGYAGGTDFKPLALGSNYLEPANGDVIVRYNSWPHPFITIGAVTLHTTGYLSITRRTPAAASLAWSAPTGSTAPTGYDIYRQKVEEMNGFSPYLKYMVDNTVQKVGSTTGLSFTDQGLDYNMVYAYYVKANYPAGNSTVTNTVRTDSVAMQDLPSTPLYLRADNQTQTNLTLHWNGSQSPYGIKEYIIYRKTTWTGEAKSTVRPDGSFVISGGISSETPVEIGRSSTTSFKDNGLDLNAQCEYYVQAVDGYGIPSLLSSPLKISVPDLTPPTAPGNLQAGDVLRQGDKVDYAFPGKSDIRNVILGPKGEIALRWEPSTDNVGVATYNVYRTAVSDDYLHYEEKFVGKTADTFIIDSGLEFGEFYKYSVAAVDDAGNESKINTVRIATEKSTLVDLAITSDGRKLTPDPAFVYFQTEYSLNVENAVKSLILTTTKTDPEAKVTVNGAPVGSDGISGALALDPGQNVITIQVVPCGTVPLFITPETTSYTLTVNRANMDNLPELTLPEEGTGLNEGDIYKAMGKIVIPNNLVWTGTADYGDGSGEKPLQLNAEGSFILEHKYLDNGQYKINVNFRYKDMGLVKGSLEVGIQNVAPVLAGVKDEYATGECSPLTIEGSIVDPGQDNWTVSGDYGSEWGATRGTVNQQDKTFTLQDYFNDQKPEYDMVLAVSDDDGGIFTKNIKIKVENVAPSVQAGEAGMFQRGVAFTGAGVFTDPGIDNWQATVDYGDGSGPQPLTLKNDKTFDLNHTYLKTGIFTVTVRVEDQDGGAGSASFQVKVKEYLFTLEAGVDTSFPEGEKLVRGIPVQGMPDKVKSITVDYGDGTGEKPAVLSNRKLAAPSMADQTAPAVQSADAASIEETRVPVLLQIGIISLQHVYMDNGDFTVKIKLIDLDGDSYEDSFKVEVANVEPTVQLEYINNMNPGSTFTCRGSITDPGADTWTVEIDYEDGSEPCKISVDPDKTFSFSHSYKFSGCYNIEAVVHDDDGGIGRDNQQATVQSPRRSSKRGSEPKSEDASLHSLTGIPDLLQDDGVHEGYGFIPDCLNYKSTAAFMNTQITVTADSGAALTYTIDGGAAQILEQNIATEIELGAGQTLKIEVTAQDGTSFREYTFAHT